MTKEFTDYLLGFLHIDNRQIPEPVTIALRFLYNVEITTPRQLERFIENNSTYRFPKSAKQVALDLKASSDHKVRLDDSAHIAHPTVSKWYVKKMHGADN